MSPVRRYIASVKYITLRLVIVIKCSRLFSFEASVQGLIIMFI
jgi:hypothetical protein